MPSTPDSVHLHSVFIVSVKVKLVPSLKNSQNDLSLIWKSKAVQLTTNKDAQRERASVGP